MANDTILLQPIIAEDIAVGVGQIEVAAPSGGTVVGNMVNLGTLAIRKTFSYAAGTLAANGVVQTTITVDGAALGYPVLHAYNEVVPVAAITDTRVQTANSVKLTIFNLGASPITLNTLTGTILVFPIDTE